MEKSLGRAFIFSLIFLMALSFLFFVIGYSITGSLENHFTHASERPIYIVLWLTNPFLWVPWDLFQVAINESTHDGIKIMYMGFLASLIVSSIIAGIFGGTYSNSLGGWILTSLVCIMTVAVVLFIDPFFISAICDYCELGYAIIQLSVFGIVNLLIFGGITLLTALLIGRSK